MSYFATIIADARRIIASQEESPWAPTELSAMEAPTTPAAPDESGTGLSREGELPRDQQEEPAAATLVQKSEPALRTSSEQRPASEATVSVARQRRPGARQLNEATTATPAAKTKPVAESLKSDAEHTIPSRQTSPALDRSPVTVESRSSETADSVKAEMLAVITPTAADPAVQAASPSRGKVSTRQSLAAAVRGETRAETESTTAAPVRSVAAGSLSGQDTDRQQPSALPRAVIEPPKIPTRRYSLGGHQNATKAPTTEKPTPLQPPRVHIGRVQITVVEQQDSKRQRQQSERRRDDESGLSRQLLRSL